MKSILPFQLLATLCWGLLAFVSSIHYFEPSCKIADGISQPFERLYGEEYSNINLHLYAHLKFCILEYGPVYAIRIWTA